MPSTEDFVVDGEGLGVFTLDVETGSVTEMGATDGGNAINLLSDCEDGAFARDTRDTICLGEDSFIEDPSSLES